MSKRTRADWIKLGEAGALIFCERCGARQPIPLPCPVTAWIAATERFLRQHRTCEPQGERTESCTT